MKKIYSKIEPEKLLHIIVRKEDLKPGRIDVVPEEYFIQCAILNMKKDKTFKPHKQRVFIRVLLTQSLGLKTLKNR